MHSILGVSGLYHDSAAALVCDGEIVAAAEEERFSRRKHDSSLPVEAIRYCIEQLPRGHALDAAVFYEDPGEKFDRFYRGALAVAPAGVTMFREGMRSFACDKVALREGIQSLTGPGVPVYFSDHHLSHAASAFYPSGFHSAAILNIDGVGEWATTTLARGRGTDIEVLREIHYPHSLGLLYSAFTYYCGFEVNSGEYKLMGLAPYGQPSFVSRIRDELVDVREDGSFKLNLHYFGFHDSPVAINEAFEQLFGGPARPPEGPIDRRVMDVAASIQKVLEELVLGLARHLRELSGEDSLCMAGGAALNCVANGVLARSGLYERLWIQPAAGDSGAALGAALLASHGLFGAERPRLAGRPDLQRGSCLGPSYPPDAIERTLSEFALPYTRLEGPEARREAVAGHLSEGKIVGYFQGRMEFGPRALGCRSILGDPRDPEMQRRINMKVKFRESWRPFAPVVLEERLSDYFDCPVPNRYMLVVAPVQRGIRRPFELEARLEEEGDLTRVVRDVRSSLPAVTHVDYSARVQAVHSDVHPDLHALLRAFERKTGCPVLVNTSFNVRGEPIVCTPQNAVECFLATDIDILVLEDFVVTKEDMRELERG